jgi:hypothetical protein
MGELISRAWLCDMLPMGMKGGDNVIVLFPYSKLVAIITDADYRLLGNPK